MPQHLEKYLDRLFELCEQFKVEKLYMFGSILTDSFDPGRSDIDVQVELLPMSPIEKGDTLLDLWSALESLFERKVDLLTDQPIKNPYLRASVEKTKQLVYDRSSQIPV